MSVQAASWRQIGTRVDVVVSDADLDAVAAVVGATIEAADRAFSRFRDDSELSLVNRSPGRRIAISEVFAAAVQVALHAAQETDGLVDPSVGRAVRMTGYDRDFSDVGGDERSRPLPMRFETVPGWRAIDFDPHMRTLRVPGGVELDLDSTGKALIVDQAARAAAALLAAKSGVLVSIGGDIKVVGRPPRGGWRIQLAEDSGAPARPDAPVAIIREGALATSSTTVRRWRRNGEVLHHLIDPRTGGPCDGQWRTATVVAADCVAANTAATCAIVLGAAAPAWLTDRALPARLVAQRWLGRLCRGLARRSAAKPQGRCVNEQLLWFASRGSGVVSLILLTAVTVLGLISVVRWQRPSWPRFLTADLHSNLALLSIVFVGVHIVAAILDPFAKLGITAAAIPFASSYRPIWVGLGVISVYMILAMIITSLLRERIGQRTWRAVHWLAYGAWPLAVLHSAGSGSDAFSTWMLAIEVLCVLVVAIALVWRLLAARSNREQLPVVVAASRTTRAPYAGNDR